ITQGRRLVKDCILEFRTQAAEVDWTEESLCAAFHRGLYSRLQAHRRERRLDPVPYRVPKPSVAASPSPSGSTPENLSSPAAEEPMQLGRACLSPEERSRRFRADGPPIQSSPHEKPMDLSRVPPIYHDLGEVFSKDKAYWPYDCAIELLPDTPLPSSRLYNLSRKPWRNTLRTLWLPALSARLLHLGFFFVKKKDSTLRPCIDFRGLNNITVKNKYPLPVIDSAFTPLQGATIFTKLDLRNAYHLVRIREGDEWKTAFNTPLGHFEYLVMQFGLTNAPAVFQALINDVLCDFLNHFVFVYLDDILIYSKNLSDHQLHVRQVLQRLLENRLFVKTRPRSQVSFLGFILKEQQVLADPEKVRAVVEWPALTNRKLLQRFLGFANFYRRFIR
ncbi:hypothetical protein L3Q82_015070, partial [Scortum barcoo]